MEELQQLRELVSIVKPLTDEEWDAFSAIWQPYTAKRKEILTMAGEKERYIYFVTEGVQRVYYYDDRDREATIVFSYAPSFGGVLDAFMLQQPASYFYETLTPSSFYRAGFQDFQSMLEKYHTLQKTITFSLSRTISGMLERMVELQCYSSEDKFKSLLQRSPHILQLVPHKYLANYLGMDPTNFSKLINNVRI